MDGTYNAADDRARRERLAEGLFVPYAVLDDDYRCAFADGGGQIGHYVLCVDGLVCADHAVKGPSCFARQSDHCDVRFALGSR